ncbi:MAG: hypothetical protein ACP5R4_05640 [Armatimonadota bacterium]
MSDKVLPTSTNSTETPTESAPQAPQLEFDDAYGYWMPTRTANARHQTSGTACGDADRREKRCGG